MSEVDVNLLAESGEFSHLTNLLSANPQFLKKVQNLINDRIQERIEIDRRRKGNIQVYFYFKIYLNFNEFFF